MAEDLAYTHTHIININIKVKETLYMNFLQIKYFISVAENMSFTKASQSLYVSQSTISKQIAALEESLGINLFYRSGRTITLSPAGESLYKDFLKIIKSLNEAVKKAKSLASGLFGQFKLGILQFVDITRILPGLIRDFQNDNPNIMLDLVVTRPHDLQRMFLDGELDAVILLSFDAEEISGYPSILKLDFPKGPHKLLYHPTEETKSNPNLSIDDFRDETFIFLSTDDPDDRVNKRANEILEELKIKPKRILWVDSVESIFIYVEEGLGVAIAGPSMRVIENERLASVPIPGEKSMTGISFCWKSTNANPALSIFKEHLEKKLLETSFYN
jgi:DNA-binding transcriptional LysR family regulator